MSNRMAIIGRVINVEADILTRQGDKHPYISQGLLECSVQTLKTWIAGRRQFLIEAIRDVAAAHAALHEKIGTENPFPKWQFAVERITNLCIYLVNFQIVDDLETLIKEFEERI